MISSVSYELFGGVCEFPIAWIFNLFIFVFNLIIVWSENKACMYWSSEICWNKFYDIVFGQLLMCVSEKYLFFNDLVPSSVSVY